MKTRPSQGFTLIELMIAVAIAAILASVAYPSYVDQLRKGRRADGAAALVSLAQAMERHHTVTGSYLGAADSGNNTGAPGIFSTTSPTDGGEPFYNLRIQTATASTFVVLASPTGAQSGDNCSSLTLTNNGRKGLAGAGDGVSWEDCWR